MRLGARFGGGARRSRWGALRALNRRRVGLATWAAWAALTAAPLWLALRSLAPPEPRSAVAPAGDFSEARARLVVEHLAGSIGPRPAGSPGARAAADYLVEQLQTIPGVEVRVQEAGGLARDPIDGVPVAWATRNVLALLPGERPESVLVSAHYDTVPGSPGAADDAAGVACALEALRALTAGPPRRHSVVLNLNGAEEVGLFGARAFEDDPWFSSVRTFVNLEAAGSGGRALLFRAARGGNPALRAYASRVERPTASAVGQDLFNHDMVPLATDFDVYAEAGLPGIDLAFVGDGWTYHGPDDAPGRLQPGSLQHMGEGLLAVLEELVTGELEPPVPHTAPDVFFDVLGLRLLRWRPWVGWVFAVLVSALSLAVVVAGVRRARLRRQGVVAGALVCVGASAAGLAASVGAGWALSLVAPGPPGWYSRPWLAAVTHGALALAGVLFVHARWAARVPGDPQPERHRRSLAAWAGAVVVGTLVLIGMQMRGLAAAHLALAWLAPAALGLMGALLWPRARAALFALTFLPGAILTAGTATLLLRFAVPLSGLLQLGSLRAPLMAFAVAVPVVAAAAWIAAGLHAAGGLGRGALLCACVGCVGLVATATTFPYSEQRPRRFVAEHRQQEDPAGATLLLAAVDTPSPGAALRSLPGGPPPGLRVQGKPAARALEVPHVLLEPSGVVPLSATFDAERGTRLLVLRVAGRSAHQVDLGLPIDRLRGSSFGPLQTAPGRGGRRWVRVVAPPPQGVELRFELAGPEPISVHVREVYPVAPQGSLRLLGGLPAWTTLSSFATSARVETF